MFSYTLQGETRMNLNRIKGLLLQELFITMRSYELILDVMVFPIMSVILFGFLANYLVGKAQPGIANALLMGMLLWQVVFIVQYSVSVGSLWNIWARNLSNIFLSPVTLTEYLFVQCLSGIIKAFFVFIPTSVLSYFIYHLNVLDIGAGNLLLSLINLIVFSISLGIIILGLIFRFGTLFQAFAWGLLPIFQPVVAVFYPVSILPVPIQVFSYLLPPTFVFEAIRAGSVSQQAIDGRLFLIGSFLNIVYFVFALLFFRMMLEASKKIGQFARLEG